jgi:hypothetical protein
VKLNDGKPWFRKWGLIGGWPIAPEGWVLLLSSFALFVALSFIWLWLPVDSPWEELCGWTAFLVALGFNVIAYWKMDDGF